MKVAISLLGLCLALPAHAQDARWVTFKTGPWPDYGRVQHQIDRASIKQEGPYKTFSTRVWVVEEKQPMTFSNNEQLSFLWQKYAVDCTQRRFGSRYIDSNNPRAVKTSLAAMCWTKLEQVPAVAHTVCGEK